MTDSPYERISETDRQRALSELTEHFGAGRLTLPEFEQRSAAAAAAGTMGELGELFVDLPIGRPAAEPLPPRTGPPATVVVGGAAVVALVAAVYFESWLPLLLLVLVGIGYIALRFTPRPRRRF